ncbi:hypothetical protein PMG11_02872 [Penicillium brasilianum]|uniref:Uncharacterized protein n=1 Tax=Penicillium brasilianum TaxID=104259 RepID=A0A0F7TLB0_PENBI|nr:hypothetical protein PMG11_02872 [Penicillium brasilianum]
MPMTWNPESDARLLIAIISTTPNINWEAAALFMGKDCSISALKHRVARLKDKAGLPVTPRAKGSKTSTKRATPMKSSKADLEKAKAKKAKTDKKAKVSSTIDDDNVDQVDDDSDSNEEQSIKEEWPEEYSLLECA